MPTKEILEAKKKLEQARKLVEDDLKAGLAAAAELAQDERFTPQFKMQKQNELQRAFRDEMHTNAAILMRRTDEYGSAVEEARKILSKEHEASFDKAAINLYILEFGARLRQAQSPSEIKRLQSEINASADPNQRRAFRVAAQMVLPETFGRSSNQDLRLFANGTLNELERERASDKPELLRAVEAEAAISDSVKGETRDYLGRVQFKVMGRQPGWMEPGPFDDILGKQPMGQVIFREPVEVFPIEGASIAGD